MAKLLPYFRWYPADAESDSKYAAMTLSELGLYHRCLNHSWLNDGLHVDVSEMARELRIPIKELKELWPRDSMCFTGVDRLRNSRQEEERQYAISKSNKNSTAGTSGQKDSPGFLYLAARSRDGAVKIGSTTKVSQRIAQLRYKYPADGIKLLASFEVDSMVSREIELHSRFMDFRVHGEWFLLSDAQISSITHWGDTRGDKDSHPSPRAYESESVFESSEEKRKGEIVEVLAASFKKEQEHALFSICFDRHRKNRGSETRLHVSRILSEVDWSVFDAKHRPFCEYWDRHGWNTCPVSMLEWWRNGMPLPPPEAVARGPGKEPSSDRLTRVMEERVRRTGKL